MLRPIYLLLGLLLFPLSASAACDFGSLLRAVAKSDLPPRTARDVTAKIRYAETLCTVGSFATTSPQEELGIARTMARADDEVVRTIDIAMRSSGEKGELPARLTISTPAAFRISIDGISRRTYRDRVTVELMPGTHEISVQTTDLSTASATVTLTKGEVRTLEIKPEPNDAWREGHFVLANIETLVTRENLPHLCLTAYGGSDGQPVAMKSLHRVAIGKRGTFEVTDLFGADARGAVCVSDAAALREVLRDTGTFTIRIAGMAAEGPNIDTETELSFGREVTIRGTAPESIRFVQRNGHELVPVDNGRFQITLPEGPVSLVAHRDEKHPKLIHNVEFHCDAEVRLTREKVEILQGGCVEDAGSQWQERVVSELEPLQSLAFDFTDGVIRPRQRWNASAETIESASEEVLQSVSWAGGLQVRAYSEDGTLVYRTTERLELVSGGCIAASNGFSVRLPLTARHVEIKGWTPQTSGRFDVADFPLSE